MTDSARQGVTIKPFGRVTVTEFKRLSNSVLTPSAYTLKTRTVIPGGNSWQINRLTGELTAYEGRGPCKEADAIKPKF
jgi:hypothetical protein